MQLKSIPILYEDDFLIVFDKPAGLIVIPSPKKETRTLVNIVNTQERKEVQQARLYPCHRLDRETSGVILFAKGKKNQQVMMDAFKEKRIRKKYIALVNGVVKNDQGIFTGSVISYDKAQRNPRSLPQPARTEYEVVRRFSNFTEVIIHLITGRSNQIRIHFSRGGYPLLGERKYAVAKNYSHKFRRVALHAFSLQWLHPVTKKNIIVESHIPKDMKDFINKNK